MKLILPPVQPELSQFVTGRIVASDDPLDLGQDMAQVALPNGILINVGWYPESSPDGQYRVSVTRGLSYVVNPILTSDAEQAAREVARFAAEYATQPGTPIAGDVNLAARRGA